jgi:hypothetical protein
MNPKLNEVDFKKVISNEKAEFRKQLPDLLEKLHGKWVIFKDGCVVKAFESLDAAYEHALELYGLNEPFLVEIVQEETPKVLSISLELGTIYVT